MHAAVPELVNGVISMGAPSPDAGLIKATKRSRFHSLRTKLPITTVPPSSSVTSWRTTTQVLARKTKA
ncbi:hypothetical protein FIBSPDRAFT_864426 [Athelia psychrophila]|uniref:Uncharacterized protein n=1 Tax=Athelia psychrophila TaxID=1759441 RepID=A0A166GGM6_9AGAM|nr:hypothetical protein FIBSPDRAFT_864426 [Fibularhizoctonia sp. CBS 109695]